MAKRTRSSSTDSEVDPSDLSESSDASFAPASSKKRSKKVKVTQASKRPATKRVNKASRSHAVTKTLTRVDDRQANLGLHSAASHIIADSLPLREKLLTWYASVHEARGMPWRKPYDATLDRDQRAQRAYEVWISEIMLQQTQVVTVIPYYNKWMARFPTINDLVRFLCQGYRRIARTHMDPIVRMCICRLTQLQAASDIETVNALWKGLGYYSRAARLLSAAQKVVKELDGRLPDNAKDMEAQIPGIGRYSAGAICSIAYNECVPVLDGNVNRLMSRVLALHANPKAKTTLDVLWAGADAMVRKSERAGDINQALIELGATVCRVRDPECGVCPLQTWCRAYQYEHAGGTPQGASSDPARINDVPDIEELCGLCEPLPLRSPVTSFPMKVERKKAREELDVVNVVEWRHKTGGQDRWFLLVKRPEGGLLAGLHEFPTMANVSKALSASAMRDIPHRLLSDLFTVTLHPYCRTTKKERMVRTAAIAPDTQTTGTEDPLRITDIKPAGEVVHIFSHIRKTYRVQWVVLEGGGNDPPPLAVRAPNLDIGGGKRKREKKQASRTTVRALGRIEKQNTRDNSTMTAVSDRTEPAVAATVAGGNDGDDSPVGKEGPSQEGTARWLLMRDVPEANIGTGVLKVWKQVSTLWATEIHTESGSDNMRCCGPRTVDPLPHRPSAMSSY